MKPFGALLSFEEAKRVVEANIKPVNRVETVSIDDAIGRVLAEDFVATLSTPPFNRAAMDGYAVKAKDTFDSGQFNPNRQRIGRHFLPPRFSQPGRTETACQQPEINLAPLDEPLRL